MKVLLIFSVLIVSSAAFSQVDALKAKAVEVKKKACPVVNGKEDCTVNEVKDKALEMKKKVGL